MIACYIYNPIGCAHSQPDHSSLFKNIFPPIFSPYHKLSRHLLFLFFYSSSLPFLFSSPPPLPIPFTLSTLYCSLLSTISYSLMFSTFNLLLSVLHYLLFSTLYCSPLSPILYSLLFSTLYCSLLSSTFYHLSWDRLMSWLMVM